MKYAFQLLDTLQTIENKYTTYFIDMVGVLYDGVEPFKDAIHAINRLIQCGKQIIFISNNPKSSSLVKNSLTTLGILGEYRIVTSGDVMRHILTHDLADKTIYHLGRNRKHELIKEINVRLTPSISQADAILLSCFVEDFEDRDIFNDDLDEIFASGKPIYCPNPDTIALQGKGLRYTSGYFASKLRIQGATVIDLGKPSTLIYDFITHQYPDVDFKKDTTLMIGDTLDTDICGATNFGIDSLLLLSGITGLLTRSNLDVIQQSPHKPTYVMPQLTY